MTKRGEDYISNYPRLMNLWSQNNTLNPFKQSSGSAKKALWVCGLGHEWEARILNVKYGSGCCYCGGIKVLQGFNDLKTKYPHISILFDEEKNNQKANSLVSGSTKTYWWKCEKFPHSYQSKIHHLREGKRCSYCAGKKNINWV